MRRIQALSSLLALFVVISRSAIADRPAPDATRACFDSARAWLRSAPAGEAAGSENAAKTADRPSIHEVDCTAVSMVIRLDGRPIGHAVRAGPETGLAASCLAEAWAMASADRRVASLPPELRARLGERVTLELEVAGRPEPLVGDRLDMLAARVDPGLEAFAIRNGDRWAFAMPSVLQARNQAPLLNYLAMGVAREAGLDPAASKDLRLPDGAAAYRVPTRRLAQATFDAAPFESWRGAPLADLATVNADTNRAMAASLASHLAQRWPTTEGLPAEGVAVIEALGPRAAYQPASASWPSPVSPPADQAIAALAMARWSRLPGLEASKRDAARDFARRTLKSLSEVTAEETDPRSDAAAMACVLLATRELDTPGTSPDADDWSDARLRAWINGVRETLEAPADGVTPPNGAAAAMVCAALGPAATESMTRRAWDPGQPERALQSTPWLPDRLPADASAIWREALDQLVAAQCNTWTAPEGPRDVDGGWGGSAAMPRPSAASGKVVLALATALARQDLVEIDRRADAMRALRRSFRFLRQLQVEQAGCHAFRDPVHAIGGLRAAPWDSDQPMAASAYALLACVAADPVLQAERDAAGSP